MAYLCASCIMSSVRRGSFDLSHPRNVAKVLSATYLQLERIPEKLVPPPFRLYFCASVKRFFLELVAENTFVERNYSS